MVPRFPKPFGHVPASSLVPILIPVNTDMKQTNYYTSDFLEVSDESPRRLWRACRPVDAGVEQGAIWLDLPFQCQKPGRDCYPDMTISRRHHRLWIRAYGQETLRLSIAFDEA